MAASPVGAIYDKVEDRESAYEVLTKKANNQTEAEAKKRAEDEQTKTPSRPTYEGENYRSGPPPAREGGGGPPTQRRTSRA